MKELFSLLALLAIGAVSTLAALASRHFYVRNGEWHYSSHFRMRRYVNGRWQYRDMTREERREWNDARSI